VVTEKVDGSMIHPVLLNNRLYLHTRKGHTDVAKQAERFMMSSDIRYGNFCRTYIKQGWTPIFEYIGPNNRIVIRYDEEKLVLLAMRNTITGELLDYGQMRRCAFLSHVPVVQAHPGVIEDTDHFVQSARELEDREGFVVYFDDGYMVKIKADDYVLQHRALDDMSSKKKIVALCAQGFMDDVLPMLDEKDKAELIEFNAALQLEITRFVGSAQALAGKVVRGEVKRKDFKGHCVGMNVPAPYISAAFAYMDGKDIRKMVIDMLIRHPDMVHVKWRGV
jgi:RNA ligase